MATRSTSPAWSKPLSHEPIASLTPGGFLTPLADGEATLTLALAGQSVEVPLQITGMNALLAANFIHDVNPVLSRLGCNAGHLPRLSPGQDRLQALPAGLRPALRRPRPDRRPRLPPRQRRLPRR